MQTDDLLAACLDAQAQGLSPLAILEQRATPDQRVELESLLDLAYRVRRLAPQALRHERRAAMTARLVASMRVGAAPGAWRPSA